MHIFFLAPDFRTLGGYEVQLATLAAGLAGDGNRVEVFCRAAVDPRHPYWRRMRSAGVRLHAPSGPVARLLSPGDGVRHRTLRALLAMAAPVLGMGAVVDALLRRRGIRRSWRGAVGRARGVLGPLVYFDGLTWWLERRMDRARRRRPPDVVDVQHSMIPTGIRYARRRRLPVVYTEYGAPSESMAAVWIGLRPVINDADFVIGRAEASIDGLRRVCGLRGVPHAIVPNAVTAGPAPGDAAAMALPADDDGVVIAAVGRLAPEKGLPALIEAFAALAGHSPPVRLVVAGDGPLRASLTAQAARLGVGGRVEFTGAFESLAPIMRRAHIVAHPTLNDGRSIAVLEAMAWGRPVVASDLGGVREIVDDGVTGLCVPPSDPAALGAALERLVRDPEGRAAMGRAARRAFEAGGYTPATMVARTLAVYEKVVARAG